MVSADSESRPSCTTALEGDEVIRLSDALIINRGKERVCFVHPHKPERVVKVVLQNERTNPANIQELKGYHMLLKEGGDLSFLSHCHGFVATDRGPGLVCDCIRDFDGTISPTIWDTVVFQDDCDMEYLVAVMETFCDFLIANRLWIFDLNLKNIVLRRASENTLHPYVIDLKGRYVSHTLIPLAKYFHFFARKKMIRRTAQLLQRIVEFRDRREELRLLD
ncbi:MAG: YrbL family protein [Desulfopila sp.]|jgi:hypothetical protein|nr:YrbL family protein [Desulfopila sp.]